LIAISFLAAIRSASIHDIAWNAWCDGIVPPHRHWSASNRFLGIQLSGANDSVIRQGPSQLVKLEETKDPSLAKSNLFIAAFCVILGFVDL
jgi:hypothetical protein